MIDTKICIKCNEEKSLKDFATRSDRKNPIRNYCKECDDLRRKKDYYKNHDYEKEQASLRHIENRDFNIVRMRESRLKSRYGLTLEAYEKLLADQDYKCLICLLHRDDHRQNFHVDHDHNTGEIRGLLCAICNRYFIGNQRTPEKFLRAINYLKGPHTGLFVTDEEIYK